MANILIVEDNNLQRNNLKIMLQEINQEYHVMEAPSASYALELLKTNRVDLFYIDIQLNSESGLKLARHLRKIPGYELTWIVFITSHVEYMLEAFKEIHCYDYVLKPYEKSNIHNITQKLLGTTSKGLREGEKRKCIFVDINGIMARIFVDDIIFIEVFGKICLIHTTMGQYEVKYLSLSKLLDMLPENTLIQSHRAYAVNMSYMRDINKSQPCWEISFDNYEKTALVGGKYKGKIMEACEEYSVLRG